MDDYIYLIGNLGFPIVISFYLLMRIENKLESLNNNILELSKSINKLSSTY